MLPHVVEDFAAGTAPIGAALLGGFLAVQMLGLVLVGSGRRLGWAITCAAGLVWVTGALFDHAPTIMRGDIKLLGLIASQATAAVLASRALTSGKPSSQM